MPELTQRERWLIPIAKVNGNTHTERIEWREKTEENGKANLFVKVTNGDGGR